MWRLVGDALNGRPVDERAAALLRAVLQLPQTATDAELEREINLFQRRGVRRGVT